VSIGKLYRLADGQFIARINYRLFHHPAATNWWGELTLIDYFPLSEGEMFILELENKQKSKCYLKKMVNRPVHGIPPRYVYHVTGFSPIK
jgi:hypothetical protein